MNIEIEKYRPCREVLRFRMQYQTFQEAWQACPRGDWMLWIAQKVGVDLRTLMRAKALCALTVRHLMKDERSIKACEVALKFADGEATREELAAAAADADAAYAAAAAAAAYADDAAAAAYADAAYAAYTAAYADAYAADAAADADAYAANADADADADAARIKSQQQTADICREHLTSAVFEKLNLS
jgi:hypothetical protein